MEPASVTFALPDGTERTVGPGALVGRLPSATVCWPDPTLSEARALVSLRGGRLWLLGLRGALALSSGTAQDVELEEGLVVRLSEQLLLRVVRVVHAAEVLALLCPEPLLLLHSPSTLRLDPPALLPDLRPGVGRAWSAGEEWWFQADGEPLRLLPGEVFSVGGVRVEVRLERRPGARPTAGATWRYPPVALRRRGESVVIEVEGRALAVTGNPGRLLAAALPPRAPESWEKLAQRLWPEKDRKDPALRASFDAARKELAPLLRAHNVRPDLLQSTGYGDWFVLLRPGESCD